MKSHFYTVAICIAIFVIIGSIGLVAYSRHMANTVQNSQIRACKKVNNPNRIASADNDRIVKNFLEDFGPLVRELAATRKGKEQRKTLAVANRAERGAEQIKNLIHPNCEKLYPEP